MLDIGTVELIVGLLSIVIAFVISPVLGYVIKGMWRLEKNKADKEDLKRLQEDVECIEEDLNNFYDRMESLMKNSFTMGKRDHVMLNRIDERVDNLRGNMTNVQDDIEDLREKINFLYRQNGGSENRE